MKDNEIMEIKSFIGLHKWLMLSAPSVMIVLVFGISAGSNRSVDMPDRMFSLEETSHLRSSLKIYIDCGKCCHAYLLSFFNDSSVVFI